MEDTGKIELEFCLDKTSGEREDTEDTEDCCLLLTSRDSEGLLRSVLESLSRTDRQQSFTLLKMFV